MRCTKGSLGLSAIRFALVTALAVTTTTISQAQTTYYWDTNGAMAGFGAAGGVWADPTVGDTTQGWSTNPMGLVVPVNVTTTTLDTLNFGNGSSGLGTGTITVTGTVDAGNLVFAAGSGAINLDGGTINLGSTATITVNNASNTINSIFAGATTSLIKNGSGNLILTQANTYSGQTFLNAGTMTLSGNGSILGSAGLTFNGGILNLINTAAGVDRISDTAPITANGGTLSFTNTSGINFYFETIGAVTLNSGQMNFVLTNNQTGVGSQTLTLSGLTRAGNTSAVTFASAGGLNTTKNMIEVTGAMATPAGEIIGPWATTGTSAANQTDYAVFNAASQVVPANIAASAESTWTVPSNAYTLNAGTTLTGTRTITALRYSGAAATLALDTNNLQTYGLLNGGTGLLTVSSTTGALTTPAGGGQLFLTAGNNSITVTAPITDNGGAVTVVKNGNGTLTLLGTNTFTGNLVINAGTIAATSPANVGGATNIVFDGSATFNSGTVTYAVGMNINNGAMVTFNNSNPIFTGNVTGTGGLILNNNFGTQVTLNGTGNTFEGPVILGLGGGTTGQAYRLQVSSFADSPTANGRIVMGASSVNHNDGCVFQHNGSTPLTLNHRQFEIASTGATPTNGHQIRSNGTGILIINTNLLVTSTTPQTLRLGGTNTGANAFNGNITNGFSSAVSLFKADVGTWALSGTNTYSGITTMGFTNPASGGLTFRGIQALSPNTSLEQRHLGGVGGFGTFRILDDATSPAPRSGVNLNLFASNTSNVMTLFVGNNNTANGGSSSGTTTGSTITLGNLNFTQLASGNTSQTLAVTGANSYRLQIGNVNLPALLAGSGSWTGVLTPTSAPLTVTGNVQQIAGSASGTMTLDLQGSAAGNLISGNILDSADATPRPLALSKSAASTWVLSGDNSYTGSTTVNAGILNIQHANALGSTVGGTTVANVATLQLQGGISFAAEPLTLTPGGAGTSMLLNVSGNNTWNGPITSNTATATQISRIQSDSGTLTIAGSITLSGSAHQLVVQGDGDITMSGLITGVGRLTSSSGGTGTRTVSNDTNNFTGSTSINGGTLAVTSIANVGTPSALGAPTTVADGTISIGSGAVAGTLRYLGSGHTSNRVINLAGTTGGVAIQANGTGPLVLTSNFTATGAGSKTLTLGGTNTGNNTIGGAIVNNSVTNITSLTKDGPGTWVLSGANTYTGPTTVSAGRLLINGTTSTGTVSVANGATLGGTGIIGGVTTVASGGTIAPGMSSGTLSINANTTLSSGSVYAFELSTAGAVASALDTGDSSPPLPHTNHDVLSVTGTLTLTGATVNITALGSTGLTIGQEYSWRIATASVAITGTPVLGTVSGADFTAYTTAGGMFYLSVVSNNLILNATPVPEPSAILAIGLGAFGIAGYVRRRFSKTA